MMTRLRGKPFLVGEGRRDNMVSEDEKRKILNYKSCFLSDAGKKVLEDLDKRCLYRRDIFDVFSARATDFNLGLNAAVRYIHSWIEKNPDEPKPETVKHEGVEL
jgi:hypothetical protein